MVESDTKNALQRGQIKVKTKITRKAHEEFKLRRVERCTKRVNGAIRQENAGNSHEKYIYSVSYYSDQSD